ncbi:MAG: flavin reductase family protein [Acidobacteriota bacterium]
MDEKAKKQALRMISYGIYVLGVESQGEMAAASVTWVSQASFDPPLLMLGVKKDARPFALLKASRRLALSFLGKSHIAVAKTFFKTQSPQDGTIGGFAYEARSNGAPTLADAIGWVEADVLSIDETGDHAVVVARVQGASARADEVPLALRDLGLFYGG